VTVSHQVDLVALGFTTGFLAMYYYWQPAWMLLRARSASAFILFLRSGDGLDLENLVSFAADLLFIGKRHLTFLEVGHREIPDAEVRLDTP
jgi:hypothetical protein